MPETDVKSKPWRRGVFLVAFCVAPFVAACDADEGAVPPAEARAEAVAAAEEENEEAESAALDLPPIPEDRQLVVERPPDAEPVEIYYELTAFEWYRRGEPIVFRDRTYVLEALPRAIPAEELRRLGRFRGVFFYRHEEDDPPYDAVFVPVYPGFWQPFVAAGGRDAADP